MQTPPSRRGRLPPRGLRAPPAPSRDAEAEQSNPQQRQRRGFRYRNCGGVDRIWQIKIQDGRATVGGHIIEAVIVSAGSEVVDRAGRLADPSGASENVAAVY